MFAMKIFYDEDEGRPRIYLLRTAGKACPLAWWSTPRESFSRRTPTPEEALDDGVCERHRDYLDKRRMLRHALADTSRGGSK